MKFVKNNKALSALIGAGLIGLLAWLAFGFFGIQTAFIDTVVDEDGPVFDVVAPAEAVAPAAVATTAPVVEESTTTPEPSATPEPTPTSEPTPEPEPTAEAATLAEDVQSDDAQGDAAPADAQTEPTAVPATPVPPEPTPVPAQPGEIVTIFAGQFSGLNGYSVNGSASVLSNGTEQRFLRFQSFAADNGPDLKVYLRAASGDFISLGGLRGNIGDQNYEIPVGVDLSVYNSVEIWCERFSSSFGRASLNAT